MARLPVRSSARLGMKRFVLFAPSGSHVAACGILAATVPPVTFTWYQRGAATPLGWPVPVTPSLRTVCGNHNDSVPPKFVYWFCTMARICRASRSVAVPGCPEFWTLALGQLVAAMGVSGPVNVESEMLFQSTWNLYTVSALVKSHD